MPHPLSKNHDGRLHFDNHPCEFKRCRMVVFPEVLQELLVTCLTIRTLIRFILISNAPITMTTLTIWANSPPKKPLLGTLTCGFYDSLVATPGLDDFAISVIKYLDPLRHADDYAAPRWPPSRPPRTSR